MKNKAYPFEGGVITVMDLAKIVTVYHRDRLRNALDAGCRSTPEVMMFLSRQDYQTALKMQKAGRKGAAISGRVIA